jgi:hypothetical protein
MNLQEQFYRAMTNSRAATTEAKAETRITEVQNGIIVTRPLKKVEHVSDSEPIPKTSEPEAQVWNLTKDGPVLQSKAGSVPGINKLKAIHDFMFTKRY